MASSWSRPVFHDPGCSRHRPCPHHNCQEIYNSLHITSSNVHLSTRSHGKLFLYDYHHHSSFISNSCWYCCWVWSFDDGMVGNERTVWCWVILIQDRSHGGAQHGDSGHCHNTVTHNIQQYSDKHLQTLLRQSGLQYDSVCSNNIWLSFKTHACLVTCVSNICDHNWKPTIIINLD